MSDRRRRHMVDRLQYRLILRMVGYWFLYQFTLWNAMFCWQLVKHGRGNLVAQYQQFCLDFWPMLLCFACLIPAIAWDTTKFYHRVAGPIFHIRRTVRTVTAKMPVRLVALREHDELRGFQDEMNAMLGSLAQIGAVDLIGDEDDSTPATDNREPVGVVSFESTSEGARHVAN